MTERHKNWVVARAETKTSRHGGTVSEITMISSEGDIAHTYIDERNRNYKNWETVLDLIRQKYGVTVSDLNYKRQHGLVQMRKDTKEPLIDADSRPRITHIDDDYDFVIQTLYEVLR